MTLRGRVLSATPPAGGVRMYRVALALTDPWPDWTVKPDRPVLEMAGASWYVKTRGSFCACTQVKVETALLTPTPIMPVFSELLKVYDREVEPRVSVAAAPLTASRGL